MSPFIISLAVRLTALLVAGGLMAIAVRRSTYAVRHIVIAATLACVVALPAAMLLVPEWRVAMLPSSVATANAVVTTAPVSAPVVVHGATFQPVLVRSRITGAPLVLGPPVESRPSLVQRALALSPAQIVLIVWLAGVLFGLAWIAVGRIGLARVRRNAMPLASYEWRTILESEAMHAGVARRVALFTSPSVSMPVTWGVLSPVIVLPEAALAWTPDRKRVVVMHEMAHIARRDSATQLVATLACVAYWLHPLVILAARRLRAECERACDERVLERGTSAADYAAHLLDVAKFSRSFGAASIVSVAMARPSQLEGRVLAVLRAEPRRARTTPRTRALAALTAAAVLIVISAFKPVVREAAAHTVVHTTLTPMRVRQDTAPRAGVAAKVNRAVRKIADSTTYADVGTRIAMQVTTKVNASLASAFAVPATQPAPVAPVAFVAPFSFAAPTAPVAPLAPGTHVRSDSTFEKSVVVKKGGMLDLDLDAGGDVDIVGTDDDKVSVSGTLGGRDWRDMTVDLDARNGDAKLSSRYVGRSDTQMFDNSFKIRVPKHFDVHISSPGGNVSISSVDGAFNGTTGGGAIEIAHANGRAILSTGGGNIRVSNSHLDGSVTTGGGTVNLDEVTGNLVGASGSSAHNKDGFEFRWPEFAKMPKMAALPNLPKMKMPRASAFLQLDDTAMQRAMAAAEREQGAVERAQESIQRSQEEMERARDRNDDEAVRESEKAMRESQEALRRAEIDMQSNRFLTDSVQAIMRRSFKEIDSGKGGYRYEYGPRNFDLGKLKYDSAVYTYDSRTGDKQQRMLEKNLATLQDPNRVIVIDKDGGPIRVYSAPNGAKLRTGGGSIGVGKSYSGVRAETGGGNIILDDAEGGASAMTGAGDITVSAGKEKAHPVDVSSGKGNVVVSIPEGSDVTLDLETAYTENLGHRTRIDGDLPLETTETKEWDSTHGTPRKYVRVKQNIGKGGALIRVRTVNGDIRLTVGN